MSKEQKESKNNLRQFWQMVIDTWQESGMSVSKFCKGEGLSEGSFYYWRKRLVGKDSEQNQKDVPNLSPFVEVSIPPEKPGGLELVLSSGNTLRISLGADSTTLANVLLALCEAGLC